MQHLKTDPTFQETNGIFITKKILLIRLIHCRI
jgi:hypothetical protein